MLIVWRKKICDLKLHCFCSSVEIIRWNYASRKLKESFIFARLLLKLVLRDNWTRNLSVRNLHHWPVGAFLLTTLLVPYFQFCCNWHVLTTLSSTAGSFGIFKQNIHSAVLHGDGGWRRPKLYDNFECSGVKRILSLHLTSDKSFKVVSSSSKQVARGALRVILEIEKTEAPLRLRGKNEFIYLGSRITKLNECNPSRF